MNRPSHSGETKKVLLSINRFETKKNLALAIRALANFSPEEKAMAKLVIAGGFDSRVHENATTLSDLQTLAGSLELTHATFEGGDKEMASDQNNIIFLLSGAR